MICTCFRSIFRWVTATLADSLTQTPTLLSSLSDQSSTYSPTRTSSGPLTAATSATETSTRLTTPSSLSSSELSTATSLHELRRHVNWRLVRFYARYRPTISFQITFLSDRSQRFIVRLVRSYYTSLAHKLGDPDVGRVALGGPRI